MSCQPPLILSILSSSLWTRPLGPCLGHLLAPGIDLNCHPGPVTTPVHGPIYRGSWVQMIFLPSPAPVFLVSWLQMTTLERAEWRLHKQFAPWICASNIWRGSNTSLSHWYMLKYRIMFVGEWSCTVKWLINNINNKSYLIFVSLYCIHTLRAVTTIDIETSIFEILALIMQHSCC